MANSSRTVTIKFNGDVAGLIAASALGDEALKRVNDSAGNNTDGYKKLEAQVEQTSKGFSLIPLAAGAAAAGAGAALVAGVGIGLVGAIALIESTNEQVKESFTSLGKGLSDELKTSVAPLTGQVLTGVQELSGAAEAAKPQLDQMFSAIGPEIPVVAQGLGNMVDNLLPGLTSAAKASAPTVNALSGLFGTLGTEGANTLTTLSHDSQQYGDVLTSLGSIAGTALNIVANVANDAANIWSKDGAAIDAVINTLGVDVNGLASSASGPLASGLGATANAANIVLHVLQPLDPLLGSLGGEALAAYGAFKLFSTVGGLLGSLGSGITNFADKARTLTTDITGSAYAGASAGTIFTKMGSAVTGAAKALPLIGVGVTLADQALQAAVGTTSDYTSQLEKTGQLTDDQTNKLRVNSGVVDDLSFGNETLKNALSSIIPTTQSVNKAYQDYQNALSPLQKIQNQTADAQTAYNKAVSQYGDDSPQAIQALSVLNDLQAASSDATNQQVAALNKLNTGSSDASSNLNVLAGYEKTLESSSSSASDKVSALQAAIKLLGENGKEAANDAVAALYTALNGLKTSLQGTSGAMLTTNGQFDLTTTKGETARSTVEGLAQNLAIYNQAIVQQGNSQDFANTQTQAMVDQMAGPLATALGVSKQKAEDLINEYYKTPPTVNTTFTSNAAQAQDAVKALNDQINGLNKSVQLVINEVIKPVASGSGGSVYTPFALPGRASGGPVAADRPYLVGENGPELIVPKNSGTVIPANQTSDILAGQGSNAPSTPVAAQQGVVLTGDVVIEADFGQGIKQVMRIENRNLRARVKAKGGN